MKFVYPLGLTLLLVTQSIGVSALEPTSREAEAILIAKSVRPRLQLRSMILTVVHVTTTGQIIVKQLGPEKAEALFDSETDKAVAKYGDEWERNMASSYREALSADELAAAARAAEARDDVAMASFREKAGAIMRQKSTPLLQKATEDVLTSCFKLIKAAA